MKKIVLLALTIAIVSCNKPADKEFKTAYVDTDKLVQEYQKAKDLEAKYKVKSEELGRELETKAKQLQNDIAAFQQQAPIKGQAWAENRAGVLRQREEQLSIAQQSMLQELQQSSGGEMDTLVQAMKKFISDYGKKEGYDYIYGTGSVATVLYAKDNYNITDKLIKMLNDEYQSTVKEETTKKEEKVEEKK